MLILATNIRGAGGLYKVSRECIFVEKIFKHIKVGALGFP